MNRRKFLSTTGLLTTLFSIFVRGIPEINNKYDFINSAVKYSPKNYEYCRACYTRKSDHLITTFKIRYLLKDWQGKDINILGGLKLIQDSSDFLKWNYIEFV